MAIGSIIKKATSFVKGITSSSSSSKQSSQSTTSSSSTYIGGGLALGGGGLQSSAGPSTGIAGVDKAIGKVQTSSSSRGGGGSSSSSSSSVSSPLVSSVEQSVVTSKVSSDSSSKKSSTPDVLRPTSSNFSFKDYASNYSKNNEGDKSKSILGKIKTKKEFLEEKYYMNIENQTSQFMSSSPEDLLVKSFDPSSGVYGVSSKEGTYLIFNPSLEKAKSYAQEQFSNLASNQKIKLIGGEVGFGIAKFGAGVVTGTGDLLSNLGTRKIISSEDFKLFDTSNFGGTQRAIEKVPLVGDVFYDIKNKPVGTIGTIAEIGAGASLIVYGGWKSIPAFKTLKNELGTSGAVAESLGVFSPLRPKPGVYTLEVSPESNVNAFSLKRTEGDITYRSIVGKGEGFRIDSKQVTKSLPEGGNIGVSETTLIKPAFIVGGGKMNNALIVSKSEGFVGSLGDIGKVSRVGKLGEFSLKESLNFEGGLSESLTRPKYSTMFRETSKGYKLSGDFFNTNKFTRGRGAGFSKESEISNSLSFFGYGKRTSIPKIIRGEDFFISEPSGRYKFKPTIKGFELDLNKGFTGESNKGFTILSPSGGKKTLLSQTFSQQSQLQSIQNTLKMNEPRLSVKTSKGFYSQVISKPKETTSVILKNVFTPMELNFEKTIQKQNLSSGLNFKQRSVIKNYSGEKNRSFQISGNIPIQGQPELLRQPQIMKETLKIPQRTKEPFGGFSDFGFGWGTWTGVIPFNLPIGYFELRKPRRTGGRRFKETPTFAGSLAYDLGFSGFGKRSKEEISLGIPKESSLGFNINTDKIRLNLSKKKIKKRNK